MLLAAWPDGVTYTGLTVGVFLLLLLWNLEMIRLWVDDDRHPVTKGVMGLLTGGLNCAGVMFLNWVYTGGLYRWVNS